MWHSSSVSLKSPFSLHYKKRSVGASNRHPVVVSGLLLKRLPQECGGAVGCLMFLPTSVRVGDKVVNEGTGPSK